MTAILIALTIFLAYWLTDRRLTQLEQITKRLLEKEAEEFRKILNRGAEIAYSKDMNTGGVWGEETLKNTLDLANSIIEAEKRRQLNAECVARNMNIGGVWPAFKDTNPPVSPPPVNEKLWQLEDGILSPEKKEELVDRHFFVMTKKAPWEKDK